MEVSDAIKKRRSIRKFIDKEISEEVIKELLEAARLAPSAYNSQPWKFFIVNDKVIIDKLREHKVFIQDFVYNSPLIIVCCADLESYPDRSRNNFNLRELAMGDLAFACQNLVLQATELGLGCCYIGLLDKEKIKKVLNIPENYIVPYAIIAGYPGEEPGAKTTKSIDEIRLK